MSNKNMTKKINAKGFTLLEILLVVGIISILAGIVILAINPTKQLGDTRNAQRRSDVLTIMNGIYQYTLDPGNVISTLGLTDDTTNTCSNADTDAKDLDTYLVGTSATSSYLTAIPHDPNIDSPESYVSGDTATEYYVHLNSDTNRITVCAPNAIDDNGATVQVTR